MKKALILLILLLTATVYSQQAAQQNIPFVDLEQARSRVAALQQENDTLTKQNEELNKQNADLRAEIIRNQQQLSELAPIIENVKAKGVELFAIIPTIRDQNLRRQAQESLDRNRELERRLEARRQELNRQNVANQNSINQNDRQISVNNARIQRNKDEVVILNAAISKTENQQRQLNAYIQDVENFLNTSERVLPNQNTAPRQ